MLLHAVLGHRSQKYFLGQKGNDTEMGEHTHTNSFIIYLSHLHLVGKSLRKENGCKRGNSVDNYKSKKTQNQEPDDFKLSSRN